MKNTAPPITSPQPECLLANTLLAGKRKAAQIICQIDNLHRLSGVAVGAHVLGERMLLHDVAIRLRLEMKLSCLGGGAAPFKFAVILNRLGSCACFKRVPMRNF